MSAKGALAPRTTDLAVTLAVLRAIRGWNQHQLGEAAGLHGSSISDYERGRVVPELRTLQRLVGAMGFPLSALDQTQSFVDGLRTQRFLTDSLQRTPNGPELRREEPVFSSQQLVENPAALRWELEQVSVEAGRIFTRMSRVVLALMERSAGPQAPAGQRAPTLDNGPEAAAGPCQA